MDRTPRDPLPPLVFVYRGNQLPAYAHHTLRIALQRTSYPVILVTDVEDLADCDDLIQVLRISDEWYDPAPFARFRDRSPLDKDFRDGFWFHAAERFFILLQAARARGWESLLHAELDVLLGPLDGFSARLDAIGSGLFLPRDARSRAIASLIYVNDLSVLDLLCDELVQDAAHGHEMRLLARFMDRFPHQTFALPTDSIFNRRWSMRGRGWPVLQPAAVGGLVDAAALGQWLLGTDPRNVPGPVLNRFRNERMAYGPARLRFSVDTVTGAMSCRIGRRRFPLLSLHVHSKALELAADPQSLEHVMVACNSGVQTMIVLDHPVDESHPR